MNEEYKAAVEFVKKHYENFPVISFFLPEEIKKHIALIYRFAREADDIADNENLPAEERLKKLTEYEVNLLKAMTGKYVTPFWRALHNTITTHKLTTENFFALLRAFKQDVKNKPFETFDDEIAYCKNSANPVGRLVLELFDIRDEEAFRFSDKITMALQLTNFYQDVSRDVKKKRLYFPLDELEKFGVTRERIYNSVFDENFKRLMKFSVERCKNLFAQGNGLYEFLPPLLKFHIKITASSGIAVLEKIEKNNYDTLNVRPELSKFDFVKIFLKELLSAR